MPNLNTILIVGGGVIGASVAYHLAAAQSGARIVVVEPDPTYARAATPRATGTVRRTFSLPEKIQMSLYGHEIFAKFEDIATVGGELVADIQFRKHGYLYMVRGAEKVADIERLQKLISVHYPEIMVIDRQGIAARFPSLRVDDVDAGLFAPDDGWIDPSAALMGFTKRAKSLGVDYVHDRVTGIEVSDSLARAVRLGSGDRILVDAVVNCANCWAADVAAMVGMKLPVRPMRRMTYYFDIKQQLEQLPLTRDMDGISLRREGEGYIGGVTNPNEALGFNWEADYDWFDTTVWPRIAHRIPAFEATKLRTCWPGHYDMNTFDGTAIIGPWSSGVPNFYVAAGFSGHGLQHAPAVGRAVKELIIDGGFQTLDLSRLGYQRLLAGKPLSDKGPGS